MIQATLLQEISPCKLKMLLVLESYCQFEPYTLVSNRELSEACGRNRSTLSRLLQELEADGLIARVMAPSDMTVRLGIILFARIAATGPVATAGTLEQIEREIWMRANS